MQVVRLDEDGDLQVTLADAADAGATNAAGTGMEATQAPALSTITEQAPVAWQEVNGEQRAVEASYALSDNGMVSFALGPYDASLPLIIDPYLTYSTLLGGYDDEGGKDIKVDAQGNIYVLGYTGSPSFPFTSTGPAHPVPGPPSDVLMLKFRADGGGLIFATYVGGFLNPLNVDSAEGLAIDPAGYMYVTGYTNSDDFPMVNAFQPEYGGGPWDAFVAKLTPDGAHLVYSTFLNGGPSISSNEAYGIAAYSVGNAYVVGETTSSNFPVVNAFQSTLAGDSDAFVTKFNSQGSALTYSTFLGGTQLEVAFDIAVDQGGNATVTGATASPNFPTRNPFQPAYGGGYSDAFISIFTPAGNDLVASTYLGGGQSDPGGFLEAGHSVAIDSLGYIYIGGETESMAFPLVNAIQPSYGGGGQDGFIAKLAPSASSVVYASYLGGNRSDIVNSVASDTQGRLYFAGTTSSENFTVTNAIQPTFGGIMDAVVGSLNSTGSAFNYSTFLGGSNLDYGNEVALRGNAAYVTGRTLSPEFPTANPLQAGLNGSFDLYIAIVSDQPPATPTATRTGTPPTATPTACGAHSDYSIGVSTGATIVPGTEFVEGSECGECILTVPLPFPIRMYGRTFTTAYVNANGYLQFTARFVMDQGECPPTSWLGYSYMPYWDDLYAGCDTGHGIYTSVTGTAPNRIFNIEWRTRQYTLGGCGDYVNFEVRMYENSPTQQVDYIYSTVAPYGGRLAVGVQMEEASYMRSTAFACSTQNLSAGMKLSLTLPACGINTPVPTGTPVTATATATPTCAVGGGISEWQLAQVGPGQRVSAASTTDGQYVYVIGGQALDGGLARYSDDTWRWSPDTDEWVELAPVPYAAAALSAAYSGGKIYVMGGYNAGQLSEHAVYDIASNTWSTAAELPQARSGHTSAAYDGRVYVFGGSTSTTATAIYDIATNAWSAGASLETFVSGARAVTVGSYIFVTGGAYSEQSFDLVRKYDPDTDTWANMSPLGTARQGHTTMTDGTYIYVVNGSNALPRPTPVPHSVSVERYNIATNSWNYEDPTVLSAMGSAGGMARGKMIYGGADAGGSFLSLVQVARAVTPCATGTPPTSTATSSPTKTTPATHTEVATPGATQTGSPNTPPPSLTATSTPTSTSTSTSISTLTPTVCTVEFSDVPVGSTFYADILCLACRGVLSGYPDGTFRPGNNITRGQIAKVVSNAAGFTDPVSGQTFQDVDPLSTFYEFVERLASRGVMSGYACGGPGEPCIGGGLPYFRPASNVMRGQASKIVANSFLSGCATP